MTPVTPSLVFSLVSSASTLTHMLQTVLLLSTTLLVIRVLHLMTLVSSTAHTFLSRWSVPSVRTPSSPRLASRPVMVSLLTHSQKAPIPPTLVVLPPTATATIVAFLLQTSCDLDSHIYQEGLRTLFFYLNKYKTQIIK